MKIVLSYETSAIILTVCLYVSVVYCSSNDNDLRSLHRRLKGKLHIVTMVTVCTQRHMKEYDAHCAKGRRERYVLETNGL